MAARSSSFASKVLMIEPIRFSFNAETAQDNTYMNQGNSQVHESCSQEFSAYKEILIQNGIIVQHWINSDPQAPDCIFANNWFSALSPPDVDAPTLILYPMRHPSRRREKRQEFINDLLVDYQNIINLSHFEDQDLALEGTGSLVIDRKNRQIFMSISPRSSEIVLAELISRLNLLTKNPWKSVTFRSVDENNNPVYHTNVILCFTPGKAVINISAIIPEDREKVINALEGYEIFEINHDQTRKFAGNLECLYSPTRGTEIIIASSSARGLLNLDREIIYVDIPTIESVGGGSAQCMLGKLF
ncbi:unnamed protein product [Blepharisma stoltei]|uniref:Amidinotransferase n=1 Tax=Blepharisma stoltei TaxID=1481888 RepID=A0AAU9JXV9_9CILI|nr:unnamed protein product [Blepharisma stoltei]